MNSEEGLTSYALCEPHRTYAGPEQRQEEEIRLLGLALKDSLKKELLAGFDPTDSTK
jgi:hypothetical protein